MGSKGFGGVGCTYALWRLVELEASLDRVFFNG